MADNSVRWIIAAAAISVWHPHPMPAQSVATSVRESTISNTPSNTILSRTVTVDVVDVPLRAVLQDIARQAGLRPFYSTGVTASPQRVTLHVQSMPVTDAFTKALVGTGLKATIVSGRVAFEPSEPREGELFGSRLAQGSLSGKVTDAKTNRPLSGATISIEGTGRRATTGDDGTFHLPSLAVGQYTVSVRLLGYVRTTRSVTITEGQNTSMTVALDASVNALDQVVVTGTVAATELRAVPNAMTVITAKDIEARGITKIDQFFRGDVPGLFAINRGSGSATDSVIMFSRGGTFIEGSYPTNAMKTFVDGIELAAPEMVNQIDPKSIERIEILTGPQASTIYGSNAINGVMQIFTKRGTSTRPQLTATLLWGTIQNDFSPALTPQHDDAAQLSGIEGMWSYQVGGAWNYLGAWSPSKQTARTSGFGGVRVQRGIVRADVSLRGTTTQNRSNGSTLQVGLEKEAKGEWCRGCSASGSFRSPLTVATSTGRTLGATIGITPLSWWSHDVTVGTDVVDGESQKRELGYVSASDTLLLFNTTRTLRSSLRYTTTANVAVTEMTRAVITAGADGWHTLLTTLRTTPSALTGTLSGNSTVTRKPDHNTGIFAQGQLGLRDAFFLTYGVRAEWNPSYGDDALPNVVPRYGATYTHVLGPVTAKLRMSYGRSTRPPTSDQKLAYPATSVGYIETYGPFNSVLENTELGPEFQQGGEGGLELYVGNRGSLVITRYNQTVDALISQVSGVDSVRSLAPLVPGQYSNSTDAEGYGYYRQSQNLNVGSIRNQGWELQSTTNAGPLSVRGTYSWTKSRVLGVTPKYRALLASSTFAPGRSMQLLPEHTWAVAVTYASAMTSLTVNVNGTGPMQRFANEIADEMRYSRLDADKTRMNNPWASVNRYPSAGYTMADVNGTHRFSSAVEAVVQVQNLTDFYRNDYNARWANIGRQTKMGFRVRW